MLYNESISKSQVAYRDDFGKVKKEKGPDLQTMSLGVALGF